MAEILLFDHPQGQAPAWSICQHRGDARHRPSDEKGVPMADEASDSPILDLS